LTIPFDEVTKEFNKLYPDIKVETEVAGSATAIRKVTELGKKADIIASADYTLIPEMMFPDYAEWYITFAYNRMVIAYTNKSRFGNEINKDNWYEILQRDEVKYGRSDPNRDPCGYRTLMVWQLAEDYYSMSGLYNKLYGGDGEIIRGMEVKLIALLESGDLDYAFNYLSVAKQHRLNFVELPAEIDLSSEEFNDFYATAQVDISGKEPGETITKTGKPVVYGITIPTNAPHPELAVAWVDFLLSSNGMAIMEANGQPPIIPAVTNDKSNLPDELRKYVTESN
jgi:molybdate/tungstate transport system substrate-binding protein